MPVLQCVLIMVAGRDSIMQISDALLGLKAALRVLASYILQV